MRGLEQEGFPGVSASPVEAPARWYRPLVCLAAVAGSGAVMLLPAMVVDSRQLLGENVWVKPWKSSVSIAIYALTVAWLVQLVRRRDRLARIVALAGTGFLTLELLIIAVQAGRGVRSHFNNITPLDSLLLNIMGLSILVVWVATLGLAVLLLAERLPDRVQAHAVGWGLVICLFGMTLGVLMFDPINEWVQQRVGGPPTVLGGAHTVGAPDGGPGIPLTHWSATAGDLRVPHFVGLHGLQLLPLTGWILATRGRRLGLARQLAVVRLVGVGYLGLVTLLLWQALRGQSIVHTDRLTLLGAAALVTGTATAILAVSRQHGSAGPRPDIRRLADPGRQVDASRMRRCRHRMANARIRSDYVDTGTRSS